jgi:hypothetical protein
VLEILLHGLKRPDPDNLNNTRPFLGVATEGPYRLTFSVFMQLYALSNQIIAPRPWPYRSTQTQTPAGAVAHPLRPATAEGIVYSRYIHQLRNHFQLKCVNRDAPQYLGQQPELQRLSASPSAALSGCSS